MSPLQTMRCIFFAAWWLILLAATTLGFSSSFALFDEHRVTQLLLIVAALPFAVLALARLRPRLQWMGIATLILAGVSTLYATYPKVAAIELALQALSCAAILAFARMYENHPALLHKGLPAAVFLVAFTQLIIVSNQYVQAWQEGSLDQSVFLTHFANRRFPAQMQAVLLPFLPLAIDLWKGRLWRLCAWAVFIGWCVCWIGSSARGAWFALSVGLVAVALCAPLRARYWLRRWAIGIGAGGLLFGLLFHALPAWLGWEADLESRMEAVATLSGRDVLWQQALCMIQAHPVLGWGPMHYALLANGMGAHPHNIWLQWAAEYGVWAAVVGMAAVTVVGIAWIRCVRATDSNTAGFPIALSIGSAFFAWCAYSMVDGIWVIPTSMLASIPVLGAALHMARPFTERSSPFSALGRCRNWVATACLVAAGLPLALLPFLGLSDRQARETWFKTHLSNEQDGYKPRFWQQGYIRPSDNHWRHPGK